MLNSNNNVADGWCMELELMQMWWWLWLSTVVLVLMLMRCCSYCRLIKQRHNNTDYIRNSGWHHNIMKHLPVPGPSSLYQPQFWTHLPQQINYSTTQRIRIRRISNRYEIRSIENQQQQQQKPPYCDDWTWTYLLGWVEWSEDSVLYCSKLNKRDICVKIVVLLSLVFQVSY